jgi:ADP-ribose pyrophosphatase
LPSLLFEEMMSIKKLNDKKIYNGRVFDLYQRTIEYKDGKTSIYDVLKHNGAVAIIPVDSDLNFWFVKQYRPAIEDFLLEIPAGLIEVGESPGDCAIRETQEEIGKKPEEISLLSEFFTAPGYSNEYMYLYLAKGLSDSKYPEDEDEYIEEIISFPIEEVKRMLMENVFRDIKTITGLVLAINKIENSD